MRAILLELDRRAKAHLTGVLLFFQRAGVVPAKQGTITLKDLQNLHASQPDIFAEMVEFLYPEMNQTANATGGFNWINLVGGVLSGVGDVLTGGDDTELLIAQKEAELAAQKVESQRQTMLIVGGVLVFAVIAAFFLTRKK